MRSHVGNETAKWNTLPPLYAGLSLKWPAAGPEPSVSIPGVGADEPQQMQRLECTGSSSSAADSPLWPGTRWDPSSLWHGRDSDT